MVGVFGVEMVMHFSPKDLGLSVGVSKTVSNSPDSIVWATLR